MNRTKQGIYLNIFDSVYFLEYGDMTFYFSSQYLMNKFKMNVRDFITLECQKLKNRYRYEFKSESLEHYFAISFYLKTETRGFRVYKDNKLLSNVYYEETL